MVKHTEPEYPEYLSDNEKNLLMGLLCKNPDYRLNSAIKVKSHPIFEVGVIYILYFI